MKISLDHSSGKPIFPSRRALKPKTRYSAEERGREKKREKEKGEKFECFLSSKGRVTKERNKGTEDYGSDGLHEICNIEWAQKAVGKLSISRPVLESSNGVCMGGQAGPPVGCNNTALRVA